MKDNEHMKDNETKNLTYRVKMLSDFNEPYMYDKIDNIVKHKTYDEYVVHDEKTFYDVLKEFLDAPDKKLTVEDIRKDFDSDRRKLSDVKVDTIRKYYNGRFDLSKKINNELKKVKFNKITHESPVVMKFNIPFELNFFVTDDNDPYEKNVSMNEAFIEIEISQLN